LLSKDNSEIIAFLQDLEAQQKNLKMDLFRTCWYMRGGVTLNEAYNLSPAEREIVSALVKDNLETTKKSGQPFF
tara:strand:+ start:588 stop:809 length:222 start_codon:yes stop_codon:yes gene_type:complete